MKLQHTVTSISWLPLSQIKTGHSFNSQYTFVFFFHFSSIRVYLFIFLFFYLYSRADHNSSSNLCRNQVSLTPANQLIEAKLPLYTAPVYRRLPSPKQPPDVHSGSGRRDDFQRQVPTEKRKKKKSHTLTRLLLGLRSKPGPQVDCVPGRLYH